jgi:hypothetical protein
MAAFLGWKLMAADMLGAWVGYVNRKVKGLLETRGRPVKSHIDRLDLFPVSSLV